MPNIKSRILIVGDEKVSLSMLQNYLLRQGDAVVCAGSGQEALALLEKQRVDLVISDLVMPGMDGIQLMQAAKEQYAELHFIFYTARASIESAVSAIRLGALDYLEKPFEESGTNPPSQILAQIKPLLYSSDAAG